MFQPDTRESCIQRAQVVDLGARMRKCPQNVCGQFGDLQMGGTERLEVEKG